MSGRLPIAILALLATSGAALGHYHYTHFASRTAPFQPIYEKFDLNTLPDRSLMYFVSEPNGIQLSANDSFPALLSQIRAAAKVWNDVETSELRLSFGGVTPGATAQPGASLHISFEETPPGYVAYGGPVIRADSNGSFVPIVRSAVVVQPDLRNYQSFSESLFSTLVHEIGHALGLQHSLASGVMSTAKTRAVSRAKPLSPDDVAGISILYPRGNFPLVTGSISGRVTMNNAGVNLASVVAIAPNGAAVSTLTNPDGTYKIQGLPPRAYSVYVHPLPPPVDSQVRNADVLYPVDHLGREFTVGAPFGTVFYRGLRDPVQVSAASTVENIDFAVQPRSGFGIHTVQTWSSPANTWVKPPYLSPGILRPYIVAYGENLVRSGKPVPGLTANVLGGGSLAVRSYDPAPEAYIQMDMDAGTLLVPTDSPRHLIFSANNDIYVLPSAFFHVSRQAPSITAITPSFDGATRTVLISGTNLTAESRVQFDGLQVPLRGVDEQGRLVVALPPAAPGHKAVVTVLNSDGQSSLFLQADNPPSFTYPVEGAPAAFAVALMPGALSPGMEAMLQVEGLNTGFTEGLFSIGFGTTDITVRRISVQSPTRALVNVAVSPNAQPGFYNVTVVSGLNSIQQQNAFLVQAPQPRPFWLSALTLNAGTGQSSLTPGSSAMMLIGSAPGQLSTTTTSIYLNDVRLPLTAIQGTQITFQIPANFPTGPAVARLDISGERSLPILINIDPLPRPEGPRITSIVTTTSSAARSLKVGDMAALVVTNAPRGASSNISVTLGSKDVKVLQVFDEGDRYSIFVMVPDDAPIGDNIPLSVSVEGRTTEPFSLTITK